MIQLRRPPAPDLADLVESVWVQEADDVDDRPGCVLPTGTVELLVHYGDRFVHVEEHGVESLPRCYLTGQRTRAVHPAAPGRVGIVIVSLHPWSADVLFPGAGTIVDGYVDLELLAPAANVCELQQRLAEASGADDRVRETEVFLRRQRADRAADPRIVTAARRLAAVGPASVETLAADLGITRRHLARTFGRGVSLRPKQFARILRFQRALRGRRAGRSWADVALDCGYADQSHLVRDVREFSGRTPGQIAAAPVRPSHVFNGDGASAYFDTVYL